jgi:predicted NUDIX family NTP pyrophosphohydrolase
MQRSAGILLFRRNPHTQVYLVHPGGPYFMHKDDGFWSIPKGGVEVGETNLEAALRELEEETSVDLSSIPEEHFVELGEIKYASGKRIHVYAYEFNDEVPFKSITTWIEFPYKSGKKLEIPENDRGEWFSLIDAQKKLGINQKDLVQMIIDQVLERIENN